jgi:TonB family protein
MRLAVLFSVISLVSTGSALADAPASEAIKLQMSWRISVDAQGQVQSIVAQGKSQADRVPAIRERTEQAIRKWRFIPGEINGKPASSQTGLHVTVLVSAQDQNNVRLVVRDATTGANIEGITPPRYPREAVLAHHAGLVLVKLTYDESGNITQAVPAPNTPHVDPLLTEASLAAARTWRFNPEIVDGHARAGESITPVCFNLVDTSKRKMPGGCDWKPAENKEPIEEGQSFALNPATRLSSDIVGSTL